MKYSLSHLIFYICRIVVFLLFLKELCNIIFSLEIKVYPFSPGGTNFTCLINIFAYRR